MIKYLVKKFINYNMDHSRTKNRNFIFRKINEAMEETFYEDNCVTTVCVKVR